MKTGHRGRLLIWPLLLALASGACRESVVLDQTVVDGGGSGGDAGGGDAVAPNCTRVVSTPRVSSLIIALDRSSAMASPPLGSGTRLSAAEAAITAIVHSYNGAVAFGYEDFPGPSQFCQSGNSCCAGDVTPPTRTGTQLAIGTAMGICDVSPDKCSSSSSERPLQDALGKLSQVYSTPNGNSANRYILVMIAMEPTCGFNDSNCQQEANAVGSLNTDGVSTIVLGIGDDVSTSACLDKIGLAGGAAPRSQSPFYYLASTYSDVQDLAGNIAEGIAQDACTVDVQSLGDPSKAVVILNGKPLTFGAANGWDAFTNNGPGQSRTIRLHGNSCMALGTSPSIDLQVYNCSSQSAPAL